jgi:predicted transcriptional regulator
VRCVNLRCKERYGTLSNSSKDNQADSFTEAKIAVGKLSVIHGRIYTLMSNMIAPHIVRFSQLFEKGSPLEGAKKEINRFADALVTIVGLAKTQQMEPNIATTVKNLERSQSLEEITTLLGLTVLSEYRERLDRRAQVMKLWKDDIQPSIPKVMFLTGFGNELSNLSQLVRDLLNYDVTTREDDIIRMMRAIQDQKFDVFEEIFRKVQKRLESLEKAKVIEEPQR